MLGFTVAIDGPAASGARHRRPRHVAATFRLCASGIPACCTGWPSGPRLLDGMTAEEAARDLAGGFDLREWTAAATNAVAEAASLAAAIPAVRAAWSISSAALPMRRQGARYLTGVDIGNRDLALDATGKACFITATHQKVRAQRRFVELSAQRGRGHTRRGFGDVQARRRARQHPAPRHH